MLHSPIGRSAEQGERSSAAREPRQPDRTAAFVSRTQNSAADSVDTDSQHQSGHVAHRSAIGNQAMLRLLSRPVPALQTKLAINQPGDQYEQEADRVADQVMRMPDPAPAPVLGLRPDANPELRRKCACGGSGGECAACKEKREEGVLQRLATGASAEHQAPPIVHEVLRSPGQPLDLATRAFFEPRFGYDFSDVRVHMDENASQSAVAINALAYTVGQHTAFRAGRYQPHSMVGRQLLAHELAHVVQQGSTVSNATIQRQLAPDGCPPTPVDEPEHPGSCPDIVRVPGELETFAAIGTSLEVISPGECFLLRNLKSNDTDVGFPPALFQIADGLTFDPAATLKITGFTDCIGPVSLNSNLRLARAFEVEDLFVRGFKVDPARVTTDFADLTEYVDSNDTPEGRARNRSVLLQVVHPAVPPSPGPAPTPTPPVPDDAPPPCVAAAGLPPTTCSAYADNAFWLPKAYVNNATCACEQTPNSTTSNCVRKFLQDRLAATPDADKKFWATEKQVEFFNKGQYDEDLLQLGLTQRIFQDHFDAYSNCCCPSGPAPFTAWVGVTTVPLGCDLIRIAINRFGSCHGTPGAW